MWAGSGTTSGKNVSVRTEWLRQCGRPQSQPSETPWGQNTRRPVPIRHVPLHISLETQFHSVFSLCRYSIENQTMAWWPTSTICRNGFIGDNSKLSIGPEATRIPRRLSGSLHQCFRALPNAPRFPWSFAKCSQTMQEHSQNVASFHLMYHIHL
jgi:hypothetical protein